MQLTGMDEGAYGWLVISASENYWRVAEWMEFDDLLQEGVYIWYRVAQKYEGDTGRVRSRKHLMQLFKTSWGRYLNHLSNQRTLARHEVLAEDEVAARGGTISLSSANDVWDLLGFNYDLGEHDLLVADAPEIIQPLLRVLFDPTPSPRWRSRYRVYADGTRETTNSRLCRLIGVDPDQADLVTPLRAYLTR